MRVLHLNLRGDTIIVTILVLLVVLVSFPVMAESSQVYYVDLTNGLPSDWTIINGGNTDDTWEYLAGGFGVFCDDRNAGPSVVMDEQLISPMVNCLKLASVFLEYYHNFNGGKGSYIDQGDVYVSNDGGASWVNVATYLPGTLSQCVIKIDITSIAAGYSKVMIKFHFRDFGSYGYWWQVFNVKIGGELKEFFDPPIADFSWSPNQQYEGASIQFTDLSSSRSGDIVSWDWYFGGIGTSLEQNPLFTFMDNDVYTVTLTVEDEAGFTSVVSYDITVLDLAPVADFTWNPEKQNKDVSVQFMDLSTSYPDDIVSWSWNFDGLGTSSEQNPTFTFTNEGTYIVTLTITDKDGSIDTVSYDITILGPNPVDYIKDLIQKIREINLNKGIQTSLIAKLSSSIWCINKGYYNWATSSLKAFINEVRALRGKKISVDQAEYLIENARYAIDIIQYK